MGAVRGVGLGLVAGALAGGIVYEGARLAYGPERQPAVSLPEALACSRALGQVAIAPSSSAAEAAGLYNNACKNFHEYFTPAAITNDNHKTSIVLAAPNPDEFNSKVVLPADKLAREAAQKNTDRQVLSVFAGGVAALGVGVTVGAAAARNRRSAPDNKANAKPAAAGAPPKDPAKNPAAKPASVKSEDSTSALSRLGL